MGASVRVPYVGSRANLLLCCTGRDFISRAWPKVSASVLEILAAAHDQRHDSWVHFRHCTCLDRESHSKLSKSDCVFLCKPKVVVIASSATGSPAASKG